MSQQIQDLSLKDLKNRDENLKELCEERRKEPNRDYPLTDEERSEWDVIRFFITKRQHENECVKIGDMFYTSWGYDQTNTEHFKVTKISPSGKTCFVRQIGSKTVPGSELPHGMADQVEPDPSYEIKVKVYDEEKHQYTEQKEHLPDLRVKIERSRSWNPIEKKHEEIGETHLRGSVYYAGNSKHLETLFRCKGSNYRSWYA